MLIQRFEGLARRLGWVRQWTWDGTGWFFQDYNLWDAA